MESSFSSFTQWLTVRAVFPWSPSGTGRVGGALVETRLSCFHAGLGTSRRISLVAVRDGSERVLKSIGWQRVRAALSPDGRYVAFDAAQTENSQSRDVFVLSADGSREARV